MLNDFYEVLKDDVFDEEPVDLKTFVEHPKYMDLPPMSDKQMELLHAMTQIYKPETIDELYADDPKHAAYLKSLKIKEVIAMIGKGGGKNHTTITAMCRVAYLLLCLKHPAAYYGKPKGNPIHMLNVAVNATQAKNTFFIPFKEQIERSPWFQGKYDAGRSGVIKFEKNITAYSGHSQREAWEGYNLIFVVLDEIAAFKALPDTEPVLTPSGWVKNGDIKQGDYVVGSDGLPVEVKGVFPQGEREVFEVEFDDGSTVRCSEDHYWTVDEYSDGLRKSRKTIRLKDFKSLRVRDTQFRYSVPTVEPVQYKERQFVIDPYTMGVLITEGCLSKGAVFSSGDEFVVERVEEKLPENLRMVKNSGVDYRISGPGDKNSNPYLNELKRLGLYGTHSRTKFIPDDYLFCSVEQRRELVRGLMDGDGTVGNSALLITTAPRLREDFVELLRSLGCSPKVSEYVNDGGSYWYVYSRTDFNPFKLPRKANNWGQIKKSLNRSVVSIRPLGIKEPMTCISVDNYDGLYVTSNYVLTHNTEQESTGMSNRADTAPEIYKMYKASITSRFPDYGKLCLLSFPRFSGDYITERYHDAVAEVETYNYAKEFLVNPDLGDRPGNHMTISWFEEQVMTYEEPYVMAARYPSWVFNPTRKMEDYIAEFRRDMKDSLSRFACNPPDAIDAFFTDKEKVENAFKEVRHPFTDNWQFLPRFVGDKSLDYYMHVDLAQKSDRAAVAVAHVDRWVQVGSGPYTSIEPVVVLDAVRWWTPSPGNNVDFTDIKEYIMAVKRRGFSLNRVTFDRWAGSIGLQHELAREGMTVETLSVGRAEYNDLQLTIYDERLDGYQLPLLTDEILGLRVDEKGRVDHTASGSNDLADAVAGAVHLCLKYEERPFDKEIEVHIISDEDDYEESLVRAMMPKKQEEDRPEAAEPGPMMPPEVELFLSEDYVL